MKLNVYVLYPMVVTRDTDHFEISLLNALLLANMPPMVVTRDTDHFEISLVNNLASLNAVQIIQ